MDKISNNTLLWILIVGVVVLFIVLGCSFSCGKEKFLSQFGDNINNPYAVDYANYTATDDPFNMRWGFSKKYVPVSDSTHEYPYAGLSGYVDRPACDNPYHNKGCNC